MTKAEITTRISYDFSYETFENLIYIFVKEEEFTAWTVGENAKRSPIKESHWGVCVRADTFNKNKGFTDPDWIFDIDEKESFIAVSEKYMEAYLQDEHGEWRCNFPGEEYTQDVLETLQSGRLDLVVRSENERYLLNSKNEPIVRKIHVNYWDSGARSSEYEIVELQEYLLRHPCCSDVERKRIPSYSRVCKDEIGIDFKFMPRDVKEFCSLATKVSWERAKEILKILETERFLLSKNQ